MYRLTIIKSFHTLIWLFFNAVLIIMFYEAINNSITIRFWTGFTIILIEFIVLAFNHWQCPLTIAARKYSDSTKENFDIYLPLWLARYNKEIYSALFLILMGIYLYHKI